VTIKVGNRKYRMTVRHVIEVRITDAYSGFVWAEASAKCNPLDRFDVWTGIRHATTKALADFMGSFRERSNRRLFWEQVLEWYGIKEKPEPRISLADLRKKNHAASTVPALAPLPPPPDTTIYTVALDDGAPF
jgi:hypothetical protein